MGFYGNITDTSKTFFQFDKIFSSRKEMDEACANKQDEVYAGRFALVKYDAEEALDKKLTFYDFIIFGYKPLDGVENILYVDHNFQLPFIYTTYSQIQGEPQLELWSSYYKKTEDEQFYVKLSSIEQFDINDTYYIADNQNENNKNRLVGLNTICYQKDVDTVIPSGSFYQCIGEDSNHIAQWRWISNYTQYGKYLTNFHEDCVHYGNLFDDRGYDGTVWEKIYHEGVGQFIQVARLNGSVPSIEIISGPPDNLPSEAYVDPQSRADMYYIKVPSNWGFRFKEIENKQPSEQKVSQLYYRYIDQQLESYEKEIDADIYLNLKKKIEVELGPEQEENVNTDEENMNNEEDPNYESDNEENSEKKIVELTHEVYSFKDYSTPNQITIAPTGKSGKMYPREDGQLQSEIDTYEASIHLPIVGNLISDGYDLIYGEGTIKDQYDQLLRPRDIEWYDGSASEKLKSEGEASFGGKTYELNTLAGTLNTIHNRLGQIIYSLDSMPSQSTINSLSSDYIYEIHGDLYRKGVRYKKITLNDYIYIIDRSAGSHFYTPPEGASYYTYQGNDASGNPVYTEVSENDTYDSTKTYYYRKPWCKYDIDPNASSQFELNKYYENVGTEEIPEYQPSYDVEYRAGKKYYLKNINPSRYTEINLTRYEAEQFYYMVGEDYICDYNSPDPTYLNSLYYTISRPPRLHFEIGYEPYKYYKLNNDTGIYTIDETVIPDPLDNRPYYDLKNITRTPTDGECVIYLPNYFYYEEKTNPGHYSLCKLAVEELTQEVFQQYNFYVFTFSETPSYGLNDENEPIEYYKAIDIKNITNNLLLPEEGVTYYYIDDNEYNFVPYENLHLIMKNPYTTPRYYYILPNNLPRYSVDSFYLPGRYYKYDLETKNYIKDYSSFDSASYYCNLTSNDIHEVLDPFYTSNKYYYKPNPINQPEQYEIAMEDLMELNHAPFYEKTVFYVEKDNANECPYGYEWSIYSPYIPPSITLYAREEYNTLIPLKAISNNNIHTDNINGLLLYLHQNYDPLNNEIRDNETFRGLLNSMKDILYQIKQLKPGHICYVNNFGQITSSDITYNQLKNLIQT